MTEKKYIFFDVESTEVIEENPDSRFMTVKVHAFSSGKNLHKMTTSVDSLKKTAPTIYDTPIIYNIVKSKKDFGTHTSPEDSLICGFCVPNTAEFAELEDGRIGLFVMARISKRYAPDVVDILKRRDGNSKVSVEMELVKSHTLDDGYEEMDDFIFYAVCLLGIQYQEASPFAHLEVLSFAEENEKYKKEYNLEFSNKYSDIDFTIPKEVKSAAKKSIDTYKDVGENANSVSLAMARFIVNNEKITVDKVKSMAKYFNQKTEKTNIGMGFYGGKVAAKWSKDIVDSISAIDEKRLSYFEEDRHVNGVEKNKVKEEKSVRIDKTEANKNAEIKFSLTSSQITEILNNTLSEFKYGEDEWRRYWVYNFDAEYVYFHDNQDSKDFRAKYSIADLKATVDIEGREEVVEGCPVPVETKEYLPEFAEEEVEDKPKDEEDVPESAPEDKPKETEMAVKKTDKDEDPEEVKDKPEDAPEGEDKPKEDEPEDKEKKMSLDSNLDMAALLAMLAEETEDYKALVAKHEAGEQTDYSVLCNKMFAKMQKMQSEVDAAKEDKDVYMAENASLKEYKDKIEKQQFDYAVEKTLQEVSDVFSKDEIDAAREDVKVFSVENLPAWQNDIKGKAFSRIKDNPKKKENFTRMATVSSWLNRDNEPEDATKEYAKKGWL